MISILGLYNYDPTIFDDLTIPTDEDNVPLFDKSALVDIICMQNAELSLLYTRPSTMKSMIGLWSASSQYTWEKLGNILKLEYNPIWNKDGTITESSTSSGNQEHKVAAFNSSAYEPRERTNASGNASFTRTEQGNIGVTSSQQLILEEEKVAEFNIYDKISEDFRNRFCVMVY